MSEDSMMELKLAFARMEATVTTKLENLIHDARNTRQALDGFVPRREAEDQQRAEKERHDALAERVSKVESHIAKAAWALAGAWFAGIGVAFKVFK